MAKDPAFLFYYQDFLVGTEFMSNQEVGCYIRILCHMAHKGRMTQDQMSKACRNDGFVYILKEKFKQDENGLFYNERLEKEVEKRRLYSLSRSKNRTYKKKIRKSYVRHMENENEIENEDKNVIKKERIVKERFGEDGLVLLTQQEFEKLAERLGENGRKEYITRLNNYIASKGKRYKSHYHTILNWLGNDDKTTKPLLDSTAKRRAKLQSELAEIDYENRDVSKGNGLDLRSLPEARI